MVSPRTALLIYIFLTTIRMESSEEWFDINVSLLIESLKGLQHYQQTENYFSEFSFTVYKTRKKISLVVIQCSCKVSVLVREL